MKKIIFNILIIIGLSSCQKESISLGTDAHDVFFLKQEDCSIPIQVHGNVASKKMLVLVHGGPGGPAQLFRDDYVKTNVEKEFAIAYFDQRFAGASEGNSPNPDILLFKNDIKKVLQLLKARYGSDTKLYILGHSWGGFLAPYFLEDGDNQNLVKGWIQADGAHNIEKSDSLTREMLLFYGKREIAANRNTDNWQSIVDFCNANPNNGTYELGSSLNDNAGKAEGYLPEVNRNFTESNLLKSATINNNLPITSFIINANISVSRLKIDKQQYGIPVSQNLYKIKIPTLLLWGKYDFICPIGLADDIKKNIGSTNVSRKIFEKSGHLPMFTEPIEFWKAVVDWVKVH